MKSRILKLFVAFCGATLIALPARSQPASKTEPDAGVRPALRSSPKEQSKKSREQLLQSVKQLLIQIQAADEVTEELRKADDGSRESRSRLVVIALIKERDRVTLMNPVSSALEQLRFSLERERAGLEGPKARREADAQATKLRIDALADRILDEENAIAKVSIAEDRKAAERRLADLKSQLASQIQLREDRIAGARDYDRAMKQLESDRTELVAIGDWIDHESRMASIRVDRLADAVQHGGQDDLRRETDDGRETLHTGVTLIRKIQQSPPITPKSAPNSPPSGTILPERTPDAPAVSQSRIDEVMKQARERKARNGATSP